MGGVGEVPLTCYLRNSSEFGEFLEQDLQLRPGLVNQILSATVDPSQVGGVCRSSGQVVSTHKRVIVRGDRSER